MKCACVKCVKTLKLEPYIVTTKEIDINETNNKQASTSELYDEAICVTNEENEANTNDNINFTDVTRRKRNHRKIAIIGDSLLKSI